MRILLIKISSMGDLIHTLPALTDAANALGTIEVDWVSDPAFAEIPHLHPTVTRVIPAPLRHWKKAKWQTYKSGALGKFKRALQHTHYDFIIDAQSALKTSFISTLANGTRVGMDGHSVREYGAHWLYHKKYFIDKQQHAITRLRQLFAQTLGYELPNTAPDFNINCDELPALSFDLPQNYIACIHATTWKTKHWQHTHWKQVIQLMNKEGFEAVLTFGNEQEKKRALQLAENNPQAHVLPKLSLTECASVLTRAKGALCVDTGLGHLAAALKIPAVHLYGPTNPQKIGALGPHQINLTPDFSCAPCCRKICNHTLSLSGEAACLQALSPIKVWETLRTLLN